MTTVLEPSKRILASILAAMVIDGCSDEDTTSTQLTQTVSKEPCTATTPAEKAVCAAEAFLDTLTAEQKAAVLFEWTDSVQKTRWSNLPSVGFGDLPAEFNYERSGLSLGDMSEESRTAALLLARTVLSDAGYEDLLSVLAADDYLDLYDDEEAPAGFSYGSGLYVFAFVGAPSRTDDWMLQITGHHLSWNVTYLDGVGYPTPHHIGVEPKGPFELDGTTYNALDDEARAVVSVFTALDSGQLASAYLRDQVFEDLLLGPDEYGTGSYANVVYPTGAGRAGVLVSTLTSEQQALVTAAIAGWVADVDPTISGPLMAAYTSPEAYADTLIAWAGTEAEGVNVDVANTYMRIDGPRLWLELSCQPVVVLQDATHYHSIYRDKSRDYGNLLE